MRLPFESEKAAKVNEKIFEAIYYGACKSSIALAKKEGHYESYPGSPAS
jgi:ribonucleotide reductase alpha subunit